MYIIIDALDECSEKEGVRGILPQIRRLPNTHILITSRYVPIIEREFEKTPHLEVYTHDGDVRIYAEMRIKDEPLLVRHLQTVPRLRDLILDTVVSNANGMYVITRYRMAIRITTEAGEHLQVSACSITPGLPCWVR